MRRKALSLAIVAVIAVCATIAFAPACSASTTKVTGLSRSSSGVGVRLTIKGVGFGSRQGDSVVTFGERRNALGFAPCSKQARVLSWRNSSITVRVPSMAPGSHKVYVTVARRMSNSYAFSIRPAKVISGKTFSSSSIEGNEISNQHDVLYEGCTFTDSNPAIGGGSSGVLTIIGPVYNVTFRDCTFVGNYGDGNDGTGVNGVKLLDNIKLVHDVTFEDCTFGEFSRMTIEAVEAGTWGSPPAGYKPGFSNIAILGSTFEPAGAEAISFSFMSTPFIHNNLVAGCTFKGFGNRPNTPWGAAIECYGQGVEWRNCEIWAGDGAAFNFQGLGTGVRSYQLFKNVTVDFSRTHQTRPTSYSSVMFLFSHVSYARFIGCRFNTGSQTNCIYRAGWADGDGGTGWSECTHNNFAGSTITGYLGPVSPGPGLPTTARGYWDPQTNEDNTWPRLVR